MRGRDTETMHTAGGICPIRMHSARLASVICVRTAAATVYKTNAEVLLIDYKKFDSSYIIKSIKKIYEEISL